MRVNLFVTNCGTTSLGERNLVTDAVPLLAQRLKPDVVPMFAEMSAMRLRNRM